MSYLTEDELMMIQLLPTGAPYVISHASQTQFSIARHYGGCKFNGHEYTYVPTTDELIRLDFFKLVTKERKKKAKADKDTNKDKQTELL